MQGGGGLEDRGQGFKAVIMELVAEEVGWGEGYAVGDVCSLHWHL